MHIQSLATLVATGLVGATLSLSAAEIDPGQPVLCAATQVVACDEAGDCVRGQPGEFNLPVFFLVDTANRLVMSARKGGESRSSEITSMSLDGESILLAGFEVTGGWNAVIEKSTGDMKISRTGPGPAFLAFGSCLSP